MSQRDRTVEGQEREIENEERRPIEWKRKRELILTKLAMRRTVSFQIGLYKLSYTWTAPVSQPTVDMVVSDMYDLYKLPRMDLECKHLLQYRRLQSCHVGEKLKQQYLSCMNDLVS